MAAANVAKFGFKAASSALSSSKGAPGGDDEGDAPKGDDAQERRGDAVGESRR